MQIRIGLLVACLVCGLPRCRSTERLETTGFPSKRPRSRTSRIEAARQKWGPLLICATRQGILAFNRHGKAVVRLSGERGRHLVAYRQKHRRVLFALVERGPSLLRFDLQRGVQQRIATLSPVSHRCMGASNPLRLLGSHEEIAINLSKGFACLSLADEPNPNMANVMIDYKIDLRSGAITQQISLELGTCKTKKTPPTERLCLAVQESGHTGFWEPRGHGRIPQLGPGSLSPSGAWRFIRSYGLGGRGDYVWAAAVLQHTKTRQVFAIGKGGSTLVDTPLRSKKRSWCVLPARASAGWLAGKPDTLVVEGCHPAGYLLVSPPDSVKPVQARHCVPY